MQLQWIPKLPRYNSLPKRPRYLIYVLLFPLQFSRMFESLIWSLLMYYMERYSELCFEKVHRETNQCICIKQNFSLQLLCTRWLCFKTELIPQQRVTCFKVRNIRLKTYATKSRYINTHMKCYNYADFYRSREQTNVICLFYHRWYKCMLFQRS